MKRFSGYWVAIFIVWMVAVTACSNDMDVINKIIDPEEEPDVLAVNFETLFTDSAFLQAKMITPLMKQFISAQEPRDEFPEGLHVWFYEKSGKLKAEVRANWGVNDKTTNIFEARGNVVLTNADGTRLESEQMFWDQEKAIIYTDKFTKYTTLSGNVATGTGMRAKQDFSQWELLNGNATIMFEDEKQEAEQP